MKCLFAVLKALVSLGPCGTARTGPDRIPSKTGLIGSASPIFARSMLPANKFCQTLALFVQRDLSLSSSARSRPKYVMGFSTKDFTLGRGGKR